MKTFLDLGCGTPDEWVKGDFIRIDPYVKEADVKAFAWDLPYDNNSVDYIWSAHMLEHLGKNEVKKSLKEWYRVLKPKGKFTIIVPDLEWCCQWWINHQTTGWDMDILFGGQTRKGEAHRTGFNQQIMIDYLKEAGLVVEKAEVVSTHNQQSLQFEGYKP